MSEFSPTEYRKEILRKQLHRTRVPLNVIDEIIDPLVEILEQIDGIRERIERLHTELYSKKGIDLRTHSERILTAINHRPHSGTILRIIIDTLTNTNGMFSSRYKRNPFSDHD